MTSGNNSTPIQSDGGVMESVCSSNPPITPDLNIPPFETIRMDELLPQRPPYLLVDRMLHYDTALIRCRLHISADHLMVNADGRLSVAGLLEHVAQTCAVRIGFINKYILHRPVIIGYVAAMRDLRIVRCPQVGEEVVTEIRVLEDCFGMTLVNAHVSVGNEEIAIGDIKIALTEKEVIHNA